VQTNNICVLYILGPFFTALIYRIAKSYLGGMASNCSTLIYCRTMEQCKSFITLGTPHMAPETALLDQTRGLLKAIGERRACSTEGLKEKGISVTCVGSNAVSSRMVTSNLEEILAAMSYLHMVDTFTRAKRIIIGDGIVPGDLAFMDGATRIEVEKCSIMGNNVRHMHVVPTPYNLWSPTASSISLPDHVPWYGSEGVVDSWIQSV